MRKYLVLASVFAVVLAFSQTADIGLSLSYDVITLQSTPAVSTLGLNLDYFSGGSGNVSMGLGLGLRWITASSTDVSWDSTPSYFLEFYSCATYRADLVKGISIEVLSRGGIALPDLRFDLSGYFAEVNVVFHTTFYGFDIGFGAGLKMYSFGDMGFGQVPVSLRVGKVF